MQRNIITILFFLTVLNILMSCKKEADDKGSRESQNKKPAATVPPLPAKYTKNSDQAMIFVKSSGGLKMRENPDLQSKTLTVIPDGAAVDFKEDSGAEITVDGIKGRFLKVDYNEQYGYAFSGFMDISHNEGVIQGYKFLSRREGSGNYWYETYTTASESNPDESRCNTMYASIFCIYRVFRTNNVFLFDSRNIQNEDPYTWGEWISETKIQLDKSFADDGCSFTRKAVFDVISKTVIDKTQKEECSRKN